MTMNMGMSKSGAETAEELKLSSLKHALHPSVLEEAMPRIAGPERLAETLTSRRHISLSRCRRLALSFSAVPEAQRGSGFSLCRPLHDSSCLLDDLLVIYNAPKPLTGIGSINGWEGELTVMPLSSPLDQDGPVEHVSLIMVIHVVLSVVEQNRWYVHDLAETATQKCSGHDNSDSTRDSFAFAFFFFGSPL
jgi:hypothetical protein